MISVLFKTMYPTKNPVVQAMRAVNGILWIYPIDFFWRLFKEKVSDGTIAAILYFLVFVAVAVIFQEKFLIALVIYLLLLFISLKLENRILKKAGFKGNAIVRMNSWGQTAAREAMKNAFDNRHAHAVSLHEPETNHQQRIP